MKQSIIEIVKVRVNEQGVKDKMKDATETVTELKTNILRYIGYRNCIDLETRRQTRVALISSMKQTQAMLWELQLILGIEDLEKLTEDYIEWQELQSIPH